MQCNAMPDLSNWVKDQRALAVSRQPSFETVCLVPVQTVVASKRRERTDAV